jgi:Holliday junction DNA helicase RuvA
MIGFLKGEVLSVDEDSAIVLVSGVGYQVTCSTSFLEELSTSKVTENIWIYTHVREDNIQLFGFPSPANKEIFLSLLKVNGVGPKMAMNILSGCDEQRLMTLIETEDVKGLSSLPKVGKKTAEQIILTLKGKLVIQDKSANKKAPVRTELHSALVNLGFKPQDVDHVVAGLPADIDFEEGIRQGLSALSHT